MSNERVMAWISVDDELPQIPKGKHSVSVWMSVFDPVFEEICPGKGASTQGGIYDGKVFKELLLNGDFYPVADIVTHWMYLPEPVQIKCGEKLPKRVNR